MEAVTYPTAVAIYDSEARCWASLAPNVDIASCGDTAEEAIEMVLGAVRQVEEVCREEGLPMPGPVSWEDFGEFVRYGDGPSMLIRIDSGAQSGGGGGG